MPNIQTLSRLANESNCIDEEAGMVAVNMHDAKSQLSALVKKALEGESVVIAKAGKPVVRLIPVEVHPPRKPVRLRGQIVLAQDFDENEAALIELFEGVV